MEAVRPEGPGVGPHEVVVVKVDDVDGARRAHGQRHALHSGWLGQAAGDVGHGAVQPHRFLDHHGQVVQSGQVSPAAMCKGESVAQRFRAQEVCESRGGRPGLPVPNKPTVSVDVNQHSREQELALESRAYQHDRAWPLLGNVHF